MKKILVIDDHQDNLITVNAVIKSYLPDTVVLTALSGSMGVELAQREQPDTIVLDIIMPLMDGYETCKILKSNTLTRHIPIIMLTAIRTDAQSRIKGLEYGADAFLSKPIDPTEFIAQLNVMLRIKAAEDELRADKQDLEEIILERTKELKEGEEKYKLLYNNTPVMLQSTDMEGNIVSVNNHWLKTIGYELNEVIGTKSSKYLTDKSKQLYKQKIESLIKYGELNNVEAQGVKKNGELIDLLISSRILNNSEGKPLQTMTNLVDFTLIKEAGNKEELHKKQLIVAKQKAEESDQLKSAFLANMSHEIRTPMNAVLGFSQLLIKENLESYEKHIYSEYIRINGESLVKIIDDIIDISKIQIKQLAIRKTNFNLHVIIKELHLYYTRLLAQSYKNIVLKLDIVNNLNEKFFVNSDDTRLKQIFNNLVSNAIKYTEEGEIIFGYKEFDNKMHFYIKDTGYGISEENQSRIFDRFFQHSNKYIARQEGTGLGLSISKELVALLGGELKVKSDLGKGSTFYFDLPVRRILIEEKEVKTSQEKKAIFDLSNYTLLIVDDEESNYVLNKRLLKSTKIKIEWASNGKKAIEMVTNHNFDLIIMDIKMPEMDGIEATRLIKQNHKTIPIIIQTAFAMPETKEEAMKAGCDGFIVKPIALDAFLELVNKQIK